MRISLDPVSVVATPWRNGAGSTRELHHKTDAHGATLWRISIADLTAGAAFSTFPGLRRHFTAIGPLTLVIDGTEVRLGAYESILFEGESAVAVRLVEPTRALNVMTRRGRYAADVTILDPHTADVEIQEL